MTRLFLSAVILMCVPLCYAEEPGRTEAGRQKLAAEAKRLQAEGASLARSGKAAEAIAKLRQSVDAYRKAYPAAQCPDGHADLVDGLRALGLMLRAAEEHQEAVRAMDEALAISR